MNYGKPAKATVTWHGSDKHCPHCPNINTTALSLRLISLPLHEPHPTPSPLIIMSHNTTIASPSNFDSVLNSALDAYKKRTKVDLASHPLLSRLQTCDSPEAVQTILREQISALEQSQSGDERLTNWLIPTVNVLYAFTATLGEGVGLVNIHKLLYREILALIFVS
jgi:hypothetical protein